MISNDIEIEGGLRVEGATNIILLQQEPRIP
jgi:hypothetical protein